MRQYSLVLLAVVLIGLTARDVSAQDFQEMLKQRLSAAINNKHESFKHDHRKNIRAPITGNVIGKTGKEFTGYGKTGVATISAETEGEGLDTKFIYTAEIPWEGHWVLKNWHGTGYNKEEKNANGKYKLKIKVYLIGGKIEFLEAKSLTDLAHDSRKMPVEALERSVLKNKSYLRQQLFP